MKIAIIVYSQTGNTYSVALKMKEQLMKKDHTVEVVRLQTTNADKRHPQFESIPDINSFDGLIFGSFAEAFTMSSVFSHYLYELPSLENKKVACFVTQFFPIKSLGGTQSINKMKKILKLKNANLCGEGIAQWMSTNRRNQQILNLVDHITKLF